MQVLKLFLLLQPDEIGLIVDVIDVVYSHANVAVEKTDKCMNDQHLTQRIHINDG